MSGEPQRPQPGAGDARFRTTRWSVVLAAGDRQHVRSNVALAELCQTYWFPVYAFVRSRVSDANRAQDLTQEFFATLLEKNYLAHVRQQRGRFRSFLRTAVQRFLSKEWAKARRLKRGGGRTLLSLDFAWGESRLAREASPDESPQRQFDRQWALQLLEIVQQRLRDEYAAAGKQPLYEQLKPFLVDSGRTTRYEEVAARLEMTAGAVKTAVYRLRRRYRALLLNEIAHTVAELDEVDDEVQQLFAALS